MNQIIEIIKKIFPILQPEWLFCEEKEVPLAVKADFYEEQVYLQKLNKKYIDIKIKGYRYILTPRKEIFMKRRII